MGVDGQVGGVELVQEDCDVEVMGELRPCIQRAGGLVLGRCVRWCNGSTMPFGGICHGSNPCRTATRRMSEIKVNNAKNGKGTKALIFVVDDEPMLLELAAVILEPLGYAVKTFRDPHSALAAYTAA